MFRIFILVLLPITIFACNKQKDHGCGCGYKLEQTFMMKAFKGPEARKYIEAIANMRISMFKEYPYLYDGSMEYEKEYLETYFKSENSSILLVLDDGKVVGFSSSIPLAEETDELKKPFLDNKLAVKDYLYIREVMIHEDYRGEGLLRKFFEHHEKHAKEKGYSHLTFITSKRPENHPMKPEDYRELGPIWEHFGYKISKDLIAKINWKQIDTGKEEENELNFWLKELNR